MKFENVIVKAVEIRHMQGTGKTSGRPYDFFVLILGDEELNRFESTIQRSDLVDGVLPTWLQKAAEEKNDIIVDVVFLPTGERGIKLQIENVRPMN